MPFVWFKSNIPFKRYDRSQADRYGPNFEKELFSYRNVYTIILVYFIVFHPTILRNEQNNSKNDINSDTFDTFIVK